MRRSDMEFKTEVLRRAAAYKARQRKLRKKVLTATLCFAVVIFAGIWGLGTLGFGGSKADCEEAEKVNLTADSAENGVVFGREEMAAEDMEPAAGADIPAATECCISQSSGAAYGSVSKCYDVVSIEISTLPEAEESYRFFTEEEKIAVIETAIEWIYTVGSCDDDVILPGGGTVYEINVTYGDCAVHYELYSNALYCESDDSWFRMDEEAHQRLIDAISQNDSR